MFDPQPSRKVCASLAGFARLDTTLRDERTINPPAVLLIRITSKRGGVPKMLTHIPCFIRDTGPSQGVPREVLVAADQCPAGGDCPAAPRLHHAGAEQLLLGRLASEASPLGCFYPFCKAVQGSLKDTFCPFETWLVPPK